MSSSFGVYVHWPFCVSKCPYCDFNSHVRESIEEDRWQKALLQDLQSFKKHNQKKVTSIFFGGGTPSLMAPKTVEKIIQEVDLLWGLDEHAEITLEANPNSAEATKFKDLAAAGINRVSLGIQALNQKDLTFLGRKHSLSESYQALEWAAQYFDRFSFDLIYARPTQTLSEWEKELEEALKLAKGHLSLYQLTIEEGTPFYLSYHRGDFKMPTDEESAIFYEYTNQKMAEQNFEAYEISNYAVPGQESRHNLTYWRYEDYIGVGPGAHSRVPVEGVKCAVRRHRSPELWMKQVEETGNGTHEVKLLSEKDKIAEFLMMGLRLKEGISRADFESETGHHILNVISPKKWQALKEEGLLYIDDKKFGLTPEGRQKLNSVLGFIV